MSEENYKAIFTMQIYIKKFIILYYINIGR